MTELELLKRKLERERLARKQAEQILETKALELFKANESLKKLNENLEDQISQRTQDLRESESRYRNVVDQATDIIYSTDEEGYFTFMNPTGSDAFGFSHDEVIGKRYIDFVPDQYKEGLFEYYTKLRDGGTTNDYYEFPIRSKSGKVHWIGQNVNRIEKPNGEFYFNAVARDITLRKKAEQELEEARQALLQSEVKYRSVLENMDLGLMEVDSNGKIMRVYDRFCGMTGYSKEELIGKDAIETLIVKGFEDVLKQQDGNRLKGQSGVYEVKIKRKDGKHIWVLISGAPFYNTSGDIIGSLGIHYNISDRKKLEANLEIERQKAVKAQQAEQQFLANMSHEIRTPLNAIIGMSHLLKDSKLDVKQEEYIDILSDSASLLKGLVSDILDISKIDSGMAERNDSAFDLGDLANRLIKTFSIRAKEKAVSLTSTIEYDQGSLVRSDQQWINQILINLLGNAVKFTQEGEVRLTVKKMKQHLNAQVYYFEVSDTGIGISKQEIDKIFSAFKQANTNVRREFGGTGLGLSIASRLVSLLGGELEVESTIGVGSRFFFSLSLQTSSSKSVRPKSIGDYSIDIDKDIKLLVVEDNFMNQKYILSLLKKWNIAYDIADNGKQAVEKYKLSHYDLIFMDLSMPVMDGYEATSLIRSLPGQQVPIIALTASTFLSKKQLAIQSGMSDFLAKPFTPEDLSLMIQKHSNRIVESTAPQMKEHRCDKNLDAASLAKLYGNDHAYALDMFLTYSDIIKEEMAMLFDVIEAANSEQIRKQAHKIKPVFSMVGLPNLSALCETIEQSAATATIPQLSKMSTTLATHISETMPLIKAEVERLQNIRNQEQ